MDPFNIFIGFRLGVGLINPLKSKSESVNANPPTTNCTRLPTTSLASARILTVNPILRENPLQTVPDCAKSTGQCQTAVTVPGNAISARQCNVKSGFGVWILARDWIRCLDSRAGLDSMCVFSHEIGFIRRGEISYPYLIIP